MKILFIANTDVVCYCENEYLIIDVCHVKITGIKHKFPDVRAA